VKGFFSSAARKAQAAAAVGFLGPIGTYVVTEGDWSWRAFAGSVITGAVAGLSTYGVTNRRPLARGGEIAGA
jgi:hypothetical protein